MTANESIQFSMALAALKRISRKVAGFTHTTDPYNECNCPKCIARDTLEQMYELKASETP